MDSDNQNWDGAGAIPYCVHEGQVLFLLQETKGGRKEGKLVDFGGGRNNELDSSIIFCGAREFSEETAGLFTTESVADAVKELDPLDRHAIEECALVKKETQKCLGLFEEANSKQYAVNTDQKQRLWYRSFAIRVPYSDLSLQNAFFSDSSKRKVRVFQWVPADSLVALLQREKMEGLLPLHGRVFALQNIMKLVKKINSDESAHK